VLDGRMQEEAQMQGLPVGIHTLSPGMVLTDLLLEGATDVNKQIFNVLCEQPETVAAFLVPRARTVAGGSLRTFSVAGQTLFNLQCWSSCNAILQSIGSRRKRRKRFKLSHAVD
jgi:chlorophyll(ide) b reductase